MLLSQMGSVHYQMALYSQAWHCHKHCHKDCVSETFERISSISYIYIYILHYFAAVFKGDILWHTMTAAFRSLQWVFHWIQNGKWSQANISFELARDRYLLHGNFMEALRMWYLSTLSGQIHQNCTYFPLTVGWKCEMRPRDNVLYTLWFGSTKIDDVRRRESKSIRPPICIQLWDMQSVMRIVRRNRAKSYFSLDKFGQCSNWNQILWHRCILEAGYSLFLATVRILKSHPAA